MFVGRNVIIEVSACHVSVTVCFNPLDELYHFLYVLGCLAYDIRADYVECIQILKKSVRIKFCDFQDRFVAFLCGLQHLVFACIGISGQVSNVGDVHDMLFVETQICERAVKGVQENVCPQVSDVCIIVNRRSASVETDVSRCDRGEILHAASHCIEQT